jgi:hypothetical protein
MSFYKYEEKFFILIKMSFSYISRCGKCSSKTVYENDICNIPMPSKYNKICYQKTYSQFNNTCEPGYKITCDHNIENSRTLLCCPDIDESENLFDIKCDSSGCSIKISFQNKKIECSSKTSFIGCLNDPDKTYVDGVQNEFPIPWLIYPKEIYASIKTIASPCGGENDYECLPYSELYQSNSKSDSGLCPSGELNNYAFYNTNTACSTLETSTKCIRTIGSCASNMQNIDRCNSNSGNLCCEMPDKCSSVADFIPSNNTEKDIFCQMICPSYKDQLQINVDTPCDYTYYDICQRTECPIDPVCQTNIDPNKNWKQNKTGMLMPNRLPTVINRT